ncbi:MAG: O-antigen ligase family protein [Betaproteobacteria bacterium]
MLPVLIPSTMNRGALLVASWAIALIGLSIPISTALDNILLGVVLLGFLFAGHYKDRLKALRANPAVVALLGFFVLIAAATLYGDTPGATRLKYLSKYSDLALIILLLPFFVSEVTRRRALVAFGVAMVVTLVVSLLLSTGLLPPLSWLRGIPGNAVVFKLQITHNLLMAFVAFLFATAALAQASMWKRRGLFALAFLAIVDVLFLVHGRTGQVALLVLMVYFFARHFGWRGLVAGVLSGAMAVVAAWYFSSIFREHLVLTTAQFENSKVEATADEADSIGLRMEWYRNTLRMIAQRPILGAGTGGFPDAYAAFVANPEASKPTHPHNQYLMTAAEMGLVGLAALLAVFVGLWRSAVRIPDPVRRDLARGLLVTFAVGCLFNSLLIDHTEALFFVWMVSLVFAGTRTGDREELN